MPTWNDPSPLTNPFTVRRYGNFNTGKASAGGYISHTHDKNLTVPNQDIPYNGSPEWYAMQSRNKLTVPNQDVPAGDQTAGAGHSGFINDRLFRLPDGTIMDYKTGRVFKTAGNPSGYNVITPGDTGMEDRTQWGSSGPSLDELINNTDKWIGTATPAGGFVQHIDSKSAAYWLKANEEAAKLKDAMTDEQKALIAAFEQHFPKSKLIEESMCRS